MIGQSISHYTILEKLGEGGMGVVYKARDTKLDRDVALKFMPQHLAPDDTEAARFLQEAKAASALNHPNVCTIYGIHEEAGERFIEMEYVEGRTLRQKLPVGSLNDAIRYGIQIGDALHEAHKKGIVHRDVKADNIMINARGEVKVMDFGLAKLKGSLKLTKATSTVGTLAYMAPEQIQGSDVDARSDIFSYGVVLYEMLTGRLPFRSEHEAALMYSILNDEPDPIQKHLPDIPPVLANLIHRALEKDPNDRQQSINEMVIELRRLQKQSTKVSRASLSSMPAGLPSGYAGGSSSGSSPAVESASSGAPSSQTVPAGGPAGRGKAMMIGGAAVALAAAAAVWFLVLAPKSGPAINPNMTFRTLDVPFKEIGAPSLSRDGGWVAFAGNSRGTSWDIFLMNTGSGEPRQVTNDSSGYMGVVDLSPDGSQIVYDRADKAFTKPEVAVVSSLGGFSKRIVTRGFHPQWRPDGKRIAYVISGEWGSASGKFEYRSVDLNGSDDRLEFTVDRDVSASFSWSPDGKSIVYPKQLGQRRIELFIRDLASGEERQLTSMGGEIYEVDWAPSNDIIFSVEISGNTNLWMVPASGESPVQITRGSGPDAGPTAAADLRRLLFTQAQSIGKIWMGSIGKDDARLLTPEEANITEPTLAPDNDRIAFIKSSASASGTVYELQVLSRSTGRRVQLLSDRDNLHSPCWSPDGKWIAYASHPDTVKHDSSKTWIVDPDEQSAPKAVGMGFPATWLDDRSFLATSGRGTAITTIDGDPQVPYFRDSMYAHPVVGGTYVIYTYANPGRGASTWIEPAPGQPKAPPRELIKHLTSWSYDDATGYLYYTSPKNEFRRMMLPAGKDEFVSGSFPDLRGGTTFRLSRDGKLVAWLDERRSTKLVLIENFTQ